MFEQYTEKARRVIFFAREEASAFGRSQIEADFVLLGIAREDPGLCFQWLGATYPELHESFARLYTTGKRVPTSVDLPLSSETQRVLAHAAEEAERLASKQIKTAHLFLGLLREPTCEAAKILKAQNRDLSNVRAELAKQPEQSTATAYSASSGNVKVTFQDGDTEIASAMWIGRIPGIGEAVTILDGEGDKTTYRIRDVIWHAKTSLVLPILSVFEISIKVQRERTHSPKTRHFPAPHSPKI